MRLMQQLVILEILENVEWNLTHSSVHEFALLHQVGNFHVETPALLSFTQCMNAFLYLPHSFYCFKREFISVFS